MTIDPKLVSQWLTEDHSPEGIAQRAYEHGRRAGMEEAAALCEEVERKTTKQPPMVGQGCQACAAAIGEGMK